MNRERSDSTPWICLTIAAVVGLLLWWLQPDSYQQDAGHHYIAARWAWVHPETIVSVWNRPFFTLLYSFPSQLGYPAAKLFTLAISLLTAYQTFRLAAQLRVDRAWLAVPLIFLQPSFFMISADTMTEPLFALLFVIALRLHVSGRIAAGALVASLLVTVRPEGFFIAVLWAPWVVGRTGWWSAALLTSGAFLWWISALVLTGDPLFILHNWPGNWGLDATYGRGPVWTYLARLPEIAGPVLLLPFLAGLWQSLRKRELGTLTSSVLVLFVVHTILRVTGWMGSAGYARYFVCVSPAIATLTLAGWNWFASKVSNWPGRTQQMSATATLAASAIVCVLYADMAGFYGRDARAVTDMYSWFREHPRPVTRLIWSQAYMNVLFDRDPGERPPMYATHETNMAILRESPSGTLVFWDDETGPAWYQLTPDDIASAGYMLLQAKSYELDGWLKEGRWTSFAARQQRYYFFYKSTGAVTAAHASLAASRDAAGRPRTQRADDSLR